MRENLTPAAEALAFTMILPSCYIAGLSHREMQKVLISGELLEHTG